MPNFKKFAKIEFPKYPKPKKSNCQKIKKKNYDNNNKINKKWSAEYKSKFQTAKLLNSTNINFLHHVEKIIFLYIIDCLSIWCLKKIYNRRKTSEDEFVCIYQHFPKLTGE